MVYGIYSNSRVISIKPVFDTFSLIDSQERVIKISEVEFKEYSNNSNNSNIDTHSENTSDLGSNTNKSFFSSSIDLLKNNKFTNFMKKNDEANGRQNDDSDASSFLSNDSDKSNNSEKQELKDFLATPIKKPFSNLKKTEKYEKIEENEKIKKNDELTDLANVFESNEPHETQQIEQIKKPKKKVNFNFDSDMDLDAFEVIT